MEKRRESFILLLILFLSAAGMWSLRCTFESPATPNWDVHLQVPLIDRRYEMSELTEDVKELDYQEGSDTIFFSYNISDDLQTFEVGDRLSVAGIESKTITLPAAGSIQDSVNIPSDVMVLNSARIKEGIVSIGMRNLTSNPVSVSFSIESMEDAQGNIFAFDWDLPANGSVMENIDISNYSIIPLSFGDNESIILFEGEIIGGGEGNVEVTLEIFDLVFSQIDGILNEFEVPFEDLEFDFDIPEAFEGFQLQSVTGWITLETDLNIPMSLDILIEGVDASGSSIVSLPRINQSFGAEDEFILEIAELQEIINANPETMRISGNILLGDGQTPTVITDEHVFSGSARFEMPLIFRIPALETTIEPDTITIDEDARDIFRDNLKNIRLYARFLNAVPLGAKATIYFSPDFSDESIYDLTDVSPNAIIKSVTLESAPIIVLERPSESIMDIEITEEDLQLFAENEELYFGLKLEFLGSEEMVQIRPSDYIEINAHIEVLANTKAPKEDENGGAR